MVTGRDLAETVAGEEIPGEGREGDELDVAPAVAAEGLASSRCMAEYAELASKDE